jgi:hypothetical protein
VTLSKNQYAILNACRDYDEVFYFLFAEVNFGGQLWHRYPRDKPPPYFRVKDWTIHVQARELIPEIVELINRRFLACSKLHTKIRYPTAAEFALYSTYACKTLDEHIAQYGLGPHKFGATSRGLGEIYRKEYLAFDELLNYRNFEENVNRRKDEVVETARQTLGIDLHSETEVSRLLSIPLDRVVAIYRSLRIGTNISGVRLFSNDEIETISKKVDQKRKGEMAVRDKEGS